MSASSARRTIVVAVVLSRQTARSVCPTGDHPWWCERCDGWHGCNDVCPGERLVHLLAYDRFPWCAWGGGKASVAINPERVTCPACVSYLTRGGRTEER